MAAILLAARDVRADGFDLIGQPTPPYVYADGVQAAGFLVRFAELVGARAGVPMRSSRIAANRDLIAEARRRNDVCAPALIRGRLTEDFTYIGAFARVTVGIYARADDPTAPRTPAALTDRPIGAVEASAPQTAAAGRGLRIVTVPEKETLVVMLKDRRLDAILLDQPMAAHGARIFGQPMFEVVRLADVRINLACSPDFPRPAADRMRRAFAELYELGVMLDLATAAGLREEFLTYRLPPGAAIGG